MSVFVKICGLRDATNVAAAVAAGADAIGFVFADSVRRVSPADATLASQEIPVGVRRVAVMRHPSNEEWQAVLDVFSPDVLQTDAEDFAALDVPDTVIRWPVYRQGGSVDVTSDVFVYEGADSGAGQIVDWTQAAKVGESGQMILAGGLKAGNIAAAIRTARPYGVDASSGVESSPGQKDPELIKQFVGAVRAVEYV